MNRSWPHIRRRQKVKPREVIVLLIAYKNRFWQDCCCSVKFQWGICYTFKKIRQNVALANLNLTFIRAKFHFSSESSSYRGLIKIEPASPPSVYRFFPCAAIAHTHYHANYYAAFVLDFDGNNIEAVCHAPR